VLVQAFIIVNHTRFRSITVNHAIIHSITVDDARSSKVVLNLDLFQFSVSYNIFNLKIVGCVCV